MKLISSVPRRMRFGLAASRPCLAFQVLFFAAAWLMPLTFEPPDMTWITRSYQGGEAGVASVGFPVVSFLRWLLAFSERNSLSRTKDQGSGKNWVLSSSKATCPVGPSASEQRSALALRWRGERCLATWTLPSLLSSRSTGFGICPGF
ncbi:hypothetical protein F2Q69_00006811 [Brassica cretica]|uniref:Uncharacterized protein n=1 Tax=Brassica cretica TaxID=69181 RepID=A0A8S9NUX7_BRACR|nr:hypothetical protein F2Q69_00006811 [Brassica cretica]